VVGLGQEELAERAHLSRAAISTFEHGTRRTSCQKAIDLPADALASRPPSAPNSSSLCGDRLQFLLPRAFAIYLLSGKGCCHWTDERRRWPGRHTKDQVMTALKLALARISSCGQGHVIPGPYAHDTWHCLAPFFRLPGWIVWGSTTVQVELRAFNEWCLTVTWQGINS
jgi:hypothetical protein